MKKFVPLAVAAAFTVLPITGAWAVDIVNEDAEEYTLMVGSGDETKDVDIGGQKTLKNVCEACEILLNDGEPVKAEGDEVVVIKDGKLMIRG